LERARGLRAGCAPRGIRFRPLDAPPLPHNLREWRKAANHNALIRFPMMTRRIATMIYGTFDDARKEYVITRPDTPYPWINYLGGEDFFSLISNTSGGYSFYKDARLLRLTRYRYNNVPTDAGGKYFYLRDGDTVWNPGWQPTQTPLDSYECRHGLGYTTITSVKNGSAPWCRTATGRR